MCKRYHGQRCPNPVCGVKPLPKLCLRGFITYIVAVFAHRTAVLEVPPRKEVTPALKVPVVQVPPCRWRPANAAPYRSGMGVGITLAHKQREQPVVFLYQPLVLLTPPYNLIWDWEEVVVVIDHFLCGMDTRDWFVRLGLAIVAIIIIASLCMVVYTALSS